MSVNMQIVALIVGCDPGVAGAIAFLTTEGKLLAVEDIPVDRTQVGKHARSKVSIPRLLSLLRGAEDARFFVEEPEFRPMMKRNAQTGEVEKTQMGVAGAGAFGITYGCIAACAVASGCALVEVRARVWKSAIGLRGGKEDSRRMAANLFPAQAGLFARVMDHNRAEAALIAYWGLRDMRGERRVAQ